MCHVSEWHAAPARPPSSGMSAWQTDSVTADLVLLGPQTWCQLKNAFFASRQSLDQYIGSHWTDRWRLSCTGPVCSEVLVTVASTSQCRSVRSRPFSLWYKVYFTYLIELCLPVSHIIYIALMARAIGRCDQPVIHLWLHFKAPILARRTKRNESRW